MPLDFTEHHARPGVFYWSPSAYQERTVVAERKRDAHKSYREAKKLISNGETERAEKCLEIAVASWPDRALFRVSLADCIAFTAKDPARALEWYEKALAAEREAGTLVRRARCLALLGQLEEAREDLDEAIDVKPECSMWLLRRGQLLQGMGLFSEAIQDYSQAIETFQDDRRSTFFALMNRGTCHRWTGDFDHSITDLDAASALDLSNMPCRLSLGVSLMQAGESMRARAADQFRNCVRLDGGNVAALNNYGIVLYINCTAEDEETAATPASAGAGTDAAEDEMSLLIGEGEGGGEGEAAVGDGLEDIDFQALAAKEPRVLKQQASSSGTSGGEQDEETRERLQEAVKMFSLALETVSGSGDSAPAAGSATSARRRSQDLQISVVGQPLSLEPCILQTLNTGVRIPGLAIIHEKELQPGELLFNRGRALLALGDAEAAEADFQAAMEVNSTHPHFAHFKALAFEAMGHNDTALEWFARALRIRDDYFPSLFHSALALQRRGEFEEALARLDAALFQKPNSWEVMQARALVLQDLNRHEEAIPALQDALHHLPKNASRVVEGNIQYRIGQSALALQNTALVESSLKEAFRLGKDPGLIHNALGLLCRSLDALPRALLHLTKAIRLNPRNPRLLFDRSQTFGEMGRHRLAVQDLGRALLLKPQSSTLLYHRGLERITLHAHQQALRDLEEVALAIGEPGELYYEQDLWEGNKFLTSLAVPPPLTADFWYHLACLRAYHAHHEAALSAIRCAVAELPQHPMFLLELGRALQVLGRDREAADVLTRVLQQQPHDSEALLRRGLAWRLLGQYEAAAHDLERARRLKPHAPPFHLDYHVLHGVRGLQISQPGERSL